MPPAHARLDRTQDLHRDRAARMPHLHRAGSAATVDSPPWRAIARWVRAAFGAHVRGDGARVCRGRKGHCEREGTFSRQKCFRAYSTSQSLPRVPSAPGLGSPCATSAHETWLGSLVTHMYPPARIRRASRLHGGEREADEGLSGRECRLIVSLFRAMLRGMRS